MSNIIDVSPVVLVEKAEICAVDYSQFSKVQLQINDVNAALASESPFNICILNSLGNEVGTVGAPTLDFSNLEVDLEVDL